MIRFLFLLIGLSLGCTTSDKSEWPDVPFKEPALGSAPSIDGIIQKLREFPPDKINPEGPDPLMARLKILIVNHPESKINRDMFNEIYVSKRLVYAYGRQKGLIAGFEQAKYFSKEKPSEMITAPVLIIDPEILSELKTYESIYEALLILYHEYLHFEQWLTSTETERQFFAAVHEDTKLSQEECKSLWVRERQSYFEECKLAISWGLPNVVIPGLCPRVDAAKAFDQQLYRLMKANRPSLANSCEMTWLQLARN